MPGVWSIFDLLCPSEGEVWGQKIAPLRAGLEERLMGIYRRVVIGPHNHHTLAVGPRKTWLRSMTRGDSFYGLWPQILKELDLLVKDNDHDSRAANWAEMPSPQLLAEAMDVCGIPYHLVSRWVHEIMPYNQGTPFTAGHVIGDCSGLREVASNDQKVHYMGDVYDALIMRKREDLLLPPKDEEC